jgi:hypothetical protein
MVIDEADEMVGSDWDQELKKIMTGSSKLQKPRSSPETNDLTNSFP